MTTTQNTIQNDSWFSFMDNQLKQLEKQKSKLKRKGLNFDTNNNYLN